MGLSRSFKTLTEAKRVSKMAFFKNRQWAVTDSGLEAVIGETEYVIPAARLLAIDGIGGGKYYDWPLHMAAKTWIRHRRLQRSVQAGCQVS